MRTAKGYLVLAGGAEFGGQMAEVDRRAIELAGGSSAQIDIIPAAAAADNNSLSAGINGVRWFKSLGAFHVVNRMLIDRRSANTPEIASALRNSTLVYLLGGFPGYLADSLAATASWQAVLHIFCGGGVIAGSSAGAMVLADFFYDPAADQLKHGLGLLKGLCIIPHFDKFAPKWCARIRAELPGFLLLGLDEETGIINDADGGWRVYGRGNAYLVDAQEHCFSRQEIIPYSALPQPRG